MTEIKELEEQLGVQSQRKVDLEKAWKKSTNALIRVQGGDSNYKVDEQTIRAPHNELVFDVRCWTVNYCTSDFRRFNESDWRLPRDQTPLHVAYAQSKRLRSMLMQSLLMILLVRNVLSFSNDKAVGLLWAGRWSGSLRAIQDALEPGEGYEIPRLLKSEDLRPINVRRYSAWIAKHALLLSRLADRKEVESKMEHLAWQLKPNFYSFVPNRSSQVWVDLKDIVKKVVKLDEEMNKSRALFTAHTWNEKTFLAT